MRLSYRLCIEEELFFWLALIVQYYFRLFKTKIRKSIGKAPMTGLVESETFSPAFRNCAAVAQLCKPRAAMREVMISSPAEDFPPKISPGGRS